MNLKKRTNYLFLFLILSGLLTPVCFAEIKVQEGSRSLYKLSNDAGKIFYVEYSVIEKIGENIWIQAQVKDTTEKEPLLISQMLVDNPNELLPIKMLIKPREDQPRWVSAEGASAMQGVVVPISEERAMISGKDVNKVAVTIDAGKFQCVHIKDELAETWVCNEVSPLAIVKLRTKDGTNMELLSYFESGAKDLIPDKPKEQ